MDLRVSNQWACAFHANRRARFSRLRRAGRQRKVGRGFQPRQLTRFGEATVVLRLAAREKPEPVRVVCELVRKGRHVPREARYVFTPGTHAGEGCEPLGEVADESRQVGLDQNAFGEAERGNCKTR